MSEPNPNDGKPEEILDHLLAELQSSDNSRIQAAIANLNQLNYSSAAILRKLEYLALDGPTQSIREAADDALSSNIHQHIQGQATRLNRAERGVILREIQAWSEQGLIETGRAKILARRYNFDMARSATSPKVKPMPASEPAPAPTAGRATHPSIAEIQAPAPRRTLVETLLSETSIKIALYLGAFFVVASAIILAALVAAARLPILFAGTAIFGVGALTIRKRLPQPSFALFIVFSFLLPITANVIDEQLGLKGPGLSVYWFIVALVMAGIWAFATWIYASRLFTVTAFLALDVSFYRLGSIFEESAQPELFLLTLNLAALVGLAGVHFLKKWKDDNFALPLFGLTQIQQIVILFISISLSAIHLFDSEFVRAWWLVSASVWVLAFVFYVWSEGLFSFVLFPWMAASALMPVAWLVVQTFDPSAMTTIVTLGVWGVFLSIASEAVHRPETTRKFSLPLLLASLPLFVFAQIWGLSEDIWLGFGTLLGAFIVYTILHSLRPRAWLWAVALIAGLGAYFSFFALPFLEKVDVFIGFKLLGASLLLLSPDLFLKRDFKDNPAWRSPLRFLGTLITAWCFLLIGFAQIEPLFNTFIVFGVYALFFTAYSLRYDKANLFYVVTLSAALAALYAYNEIDPDLWLPGLTALSALYYLAGFLIGRDGGRQDWANVSRYSGLALGAIVSCAALVMTQETGGYYAIAIGFLFLIETFLRQNGYFEIGMPALFNIGAFLILHDFKVAETSYHLLAYTLIWLGSDLLHHLAFKSARPLEWPVRGLGGLFGVINTLALILPGSTDSRVAWVCSAVSTIFFAAYAFLYRRPTLGYIPAAYLPLTIVYLLRDFEQDKWLFPIIGIAILYYAAGYLLRRAARGNDWELTLLFSGLGLGTITALSAPLQGGLDAAIPVAIAATIWAVEAFARRNVWLGFPANALYLMAYFMILAELKVDEPQFFSIGAALLGMLMHYLLTRAGSKTGAFITGMVSQLVLLSTTYIQMLNTEKLSFFVVLFLQSLVVLGYGIIIRSRSLVFTPIVFVVLGVITVVYSALKGISTVILIGCTGIILLLLGILAVVLRERLVKIGEQFSDWRA